jgi:hypothetical protein
MSSCSDTSRIRDFQERSSWVYKHGLVKRALNEILGQNGWRSATRDGSHWVTATAQARPHAASVPEPSPGFSPGDDLNRE